MKEGPRGLTNGNETFRSSMLTYLTAQDLRGGKAGIPLGDDVALGCAARRCLVGWMVGCGEMQGAADLWMMGNERETQALT